MITQWAGSSVRMSSKAGSLNGKRFNSCCDCGLFLDIFLNSSTLTSPIVDQISLLFTVENYVGYVVQNEEVINISLSLSRQILYNYSFT
jgi:hypothetical protein